MVEMSDVRVVVVASMWDDRECSVVGSDVSFDKRESGDVLGCEVMRVVRVGVKEGSISISSINKESSIFSP